MFLSELVFVGSANLFCLFGLSFVNTFLKKEGGVRMTHHDTSPSGESESGQMSYVNESAGLLDAVGRKS